MYEYKTVRRLISGESDILVRCPHIELEQLNSVVYDTLESPHFLGTSPHIHAGYKTALDSVPGVTIYRIVHSLIKREPGIVMRATKQSHGSSLVIAAASLSGDDPDLKVWIDFVDHFLFYIESPLSKLLKAEFDTIKVLVDFPADKLEEYVAHFLASFPWRYPPGTRHYLVSSHGRCFFLGNPELVTKDQGAKGCSSSDPYEAGWIGSVNIDRLTDRKCELQMVAFTGSYQVQCEEAFHALVEHLSQNKELPTLGRPSGLSDRTQELADFILAKKIENPGWSYEKMAIEAGIALNRSDIDKETVKNTYRRVLKPTGFVWKRADRVR